MNIEIDVSFINVFLYTIEETLFNHSVLTLLSVVKMHSFSTF